MSELMAEPTAVTAPAMSVVVLAYGAEEWLHAAVAAVLASEGVEVELVVVDNGCTSDAVATLRPDPRLRVITPGTNTGFAGGVNLGAEAASHDVVVMLNSDAEVEPGALAALAAAIDDGADLAGAVILLADQPDLINSAGNPLHVLGLVWAGRLEQPRAGLGPDWQPATLSGACLAVRRSAWDRLGGFAEEFFAYHEDVDLCWRARQLGMRLDLVTEAGVRHHYEFSRNPRKMFLMERNRLLFVLTTYGPGTLATLALPLVAFDVALLAVAARQGWAVEKVRGWAWLARHLPYLRDRRALVQAARTVPDRDLYPWLTATFDARQMPLPAAGRPLQATLRAWWGLVRRISSRSRRSRPGAR